MKNTSGSWETYEGRRRRIYVSRRNGRVGENVNTSIRLTGRQHEFLLSYGTGNISAAVRDAVDRLMESEGVQ